MSSVALLRLTIGLACIVSIYQALLFHLGTAPSEDFGRVWGYTFAGLLAFWVDTDSKARPEIYRPSFDMGLFVCCAWILYVPYYLIRTRGRMGWVWLFGFVALIFLGTALEWLVYAAS